MCAYCTINKLTHIWLTWQPPHPGIALNISHPPIGSHSHLQHLWHAWQPRSTKLHSIDYFQVCSILIGQIAPPDPLPQQALQGLQFIIWAWESDGWLGQWRFGSWWHWQAPACTCAVLKLAEGERGSRMLPMDIHEWGKKKTCTFVNNL